MAVTNSVIRKDADCKYFLFVPGIDRTDLPAPAAPDKGAVWFTDRRTRWLWDEDKGMAKKYLQAGRIRNAGVNTAADHKSLTRHRSYHWATEKYPLTSFTVVTQSGALADILDACVPQENPPPLRVRDPSLVDPPEVPILGVYMLFWDRQPCFFVKAVHPRGMVHGKDEPMGMLRLASPSSEYTERFNAALRPLAIISHLMCTLGLEPSAAADQVWAALLASPLCSWTTSRVSSRRVDACPRWLPPRHVWGQGQPTKEAGPSPWRWRRWWQTAARGEGSSRWQHHHPPLLRPTCWHPQPHKSRPALPLALPPVCVEAAQKHLPAWPLVGKRARWGARRGENRGLWCRVVRCRQQAWCLRGMRIA
eukprot:jgi/Mesvir1/17814/Mv25366-RA.6